jgi:HTH-type transcriptional regulator/antitoxin HigA
MMITNGGSVPHPGYFIREELAARGWNQRDLAFILGCDETSVNAILSGRRGISPDMAKALGAAFDVNPDFFINLQRRFEMAQARDPDPGVVKRGRIHDRYPLREMIKRGWLEDTDAMLLEAQLIQFFECPSADEIPYMQHAAYKTKYSDETPPSQLVWLFRARQIAKSVACPRYSEKLLRDALPRLRELTTEPEEIRHVPRIMAECGVRFAVIEGLPGSKIDGVCFWLDQHSPVIAMSLRHDRIDNFWFVLPHEIEHVLKKHGFGAHQEIIDVELEGERASENTAIAEEERIANRAAADFAFPETELSSFIARNQPFFYERDIVGFARRLRVHPGIAVGRFQRRMEKYNYLRKYQVKIRQFLNPTAIVDGWGQVAPI